MSVLLVEGGAAFRDEECDLGADALAQEAREVLVAVSAVHQRCRDDLQRSGLVVHSSREGRFLGVDEHPVDDVFVVDDDGAVPSDVVDGICFLVSLAQSVKQLLRRLQNSELHGPPIWKLRVEVPRCRSASAHRGWPSSDTYTGSRTLRR